MSDDERKCVKEEPSLNGKQDPSIEGEGDSNGTENGSFEEGLSSAAEVDSIEDEVVSPENGNLSLEEESTPMGDEGSSVEEECSSSTIKETPTVEERRPTVKKEGSTVEEERSTIDKGNATMEEGCAATERESPSEGKLSPTEKECQTIEQAVVYKKITPADKEHELIDNGLPSPKEGFVDKGCQTNSVAEPIDREIQTTLRIERSLSSSSLDASMADDSGNSLKECPSIEEEPPPEPIEGELLKVRAQVMIRNDSTGGWVPEGCGGMSLVTVIKIETPRKPGDDSPVVNKYMIKGKRLSDQKDTLCCTIVKDFEYNKVMPTFHHWKSGNEKFGLTFQTTIEARSFDRVVRDAVYSYLLELDPNALPLKFAGDDDDDFLAFTKPAEPRPRTPSPEVVYELPDYLLPNFEEEERIQFMQLTSLPEYMYKDYRADDHTADNKLKRRPLYRTRKPLKLFGTIRRTSRLRCKYCHELYEEDENKRGQCRFAPSITKKVIDGLSCMRCAKFFLFDCMVDPEEEFSHPCSCKNDGHRGFRWFGLCILSFCLPCVLLYPPMKGCYECGVLCGVCGGRHEEKIVKHVEHII